MRGGGPGLGGLPRRPIARDLSQSFTDHTGEDNIERDYLHQQLTPEGPGGVWERGSVWQRLGASAGNVKQRLAASGSV